MSGIINSAGSKSYVIGEADKALVYFGYMPSNMTSSGTAQWTDVTDSIPGNSMSSGVYTVNKAGYYEVNCEAHYYTTATSLHYSAISIKKGSTQLMYSGYLGDYKTINNTNRNTCTYIGHWSAGETIVITMVSSGHTIYGSSSKNTTLALKYIGK